ncbi:MAG: phosphoglycerate kinase [Nitrospirae bacterium]|nr:phosphoglycerate kinase [Nitrospirota bacterium]MBF0542192.1 phosphoglycerate kinase [Nitrospirota bacterium]
MATFKKLVITDLNLKGKKVFIRVDFNVPLDDSQNITDDTRIKRALPTITKAIDMGGRVVLASHLGRPKGKVNPALSLKPVAERLSKLLGRPVVFAKDCIGSEVESLVKGLKDGDVMLLENLRFHDAETKNDETFSKALAGLVDVYVNDAFGTAHRAHSSTAGITKFVKQAAAGFLLEKEINYLSGAVNNPERPFVAIIGGAKVSGKIDVLENLADKVNAVIVGGGMANTFFKSRGYAIGDSLCEDEMLETAKTITTKLEKNNVKFYLPTDCVVAKDIEPGTETKIVPVDKVPAGWKILDIGPESSKLFKSALSDAKTIVWNGPMGMFEQEAFSKGTYSLAHAVAESKAVSIIGGGDSVLAVKRAGVEDKVTFISTGGGASLELLEGKILPGLAALTDK